MSYFGMFREGALEEVKLAIRDLIGFIEENEPRLIAYNVYFNPDGTKMTVVSVHPDSAFVGVPPDGGLVRSFAHSSNSSRCPRSTSTASRAKGC